MQAHARMHHIDHWPQCFWFYEFDRKMTLMTLPAASGEFWSKSMLSGSLKTSLLALANQLGYYGARISHERSGLWYNSWINNDQQDPVDTCWYILQAFCLLTFLSLPLSLISYCHIPYFILFEDHSEDVWWCIVMLFLCEWMCTASARPHRDIYVIDGSARSSHSNAFCTGLDVGFWRFSKTNRATLSIPTWAFGNKFCVLREVPTCLESWNVSYVFCGILPGGSRLCNCCIAEDFSDLGAFACFCLFPNCSLEALAVSGAFASSIHFCLWWVRRVQSGSPKYFKFVCVDSMSAIFKFILIIYMIIYDNHLSCIS